MAEESMRGDAVASAPKVKLRMEHNWVSGTNDPLGVVERCTVCGAEVTIRDVKAALPDRPAVKDEPCLLRCSYTFSPERQCQKIHDHAGDHVWGEPGVGQSAVR